MTMKVEAAEKAKRLLPCDCDAGNAPIPCPHQEHCISQYQYAVAAALREADAEIERLKKLDEIGSNAHNANLLEMGDMRAVIHRLKAERDSWKEATIKANEHYDELQRLFDQYKQDVAEDKQDDFVRGLERAKEACIPWLLCKCDEAYTSRGRHESNAWHELAEEIDAAIQAEIDRREVKR